MVKNLPTMQEAWVQSLGLEDPLEKGMATHSGILAWEIPWTEEAGGLQSMGLQRVKHDWVTEHIHIHQEIQWLRKNLLELSKHVMLQSWLWYMKKSDYKKIYVIKIKFYKFLYRQNIIHIYVLETVCIIKWIGRSWRFLGAVIVYNMFLLPGKTLIKFLQKITYYI